MATMLTRSTTLKGQSFCFLATRIRWMRTSENTPKPKMKAVRMFEKFETTGMASASQNETS